MTASTKPFPLGAVILVVVINAVFFFAFARVGGFVGAETGTDGYKEIAENLLQGNGLIFAPGQPSTMMLGYMKREPVYPLFLSAILALTGNLNPAVLSFFQTLLCALSCYLLLRLGTQVFDERTGRLGSYIYALHPVSFWYTSRFASEVVAIPVLLLCLLVIERFFREINWSNALAVGLSLGFAALTKSAYAVLLPLVLLFLVVRAWRSASRFLTAAVIVILSFASVHSLWLMRNFTISGEVVPFTTMNGVAFFLGNRIIERFDVNALTAETEPDRWANALYGSVQADIAARQPDLSLPRLEAETDKKLKAMGSELVWSRPSFIVLKVLAGSVLIWFLSDTTAKSLGWAAFQLPLLVMAIVGISRRPQWSLVSQFLLTFAIVFLLAYVMVSPLARYSSPVMPVLMLFGSGGLMIALEWLGWPVRANEPRLSGPSVPSRETTT
jgi:4-amino-4-deoxy-L-arabinose transferase-like glycosyltransferase